MIEITQRGELNVRIRWRQVTFQTTAAFKSLPKLLQHLKVFPNHCDIYLSSQTAVTFTGLPKPLQHLTLPKSFSFRDTLLFKAKVLQFSRQTVVLSQFPHYSEHVAY